MADSLARDTADSLARLAPVRGRVAVVALGAGPARVAGAIRRLTFVPDGGDGRLLATLADETGELTARVPRSHARDWSPGSLVAAEGAMQGSEFVVRAYLPQPAGVRPQPAGVWVEVAPIPSPPG